MNNKSRLTSTVLRGIVFLSFLLAPLIQAGASAEAVSNLPNYPGAVEKSAVPEGLTSGKWENIQRAIHQAEYYPTWHAPSRAYSAPNRANDFLLAFSRDGLSVKSASPSETWTWNLDLIGFGFSGAVLPIAHRPVMTVETNRFEYRWSEALVEWYINDEHGLEQGFTISTPPSVSDHLTGTSTASNIVLEMDLNTDLIPQLAADAQSVTFRLPANGAWKTGPAVLGYDSLVVTDASAEECPPE